MSEPPAQFFVDSLTVSVRTAWHGLVDALAHARGWFLVAAVLFGVQAGVPAAEVWLLKHLIEVLSDPSATVAALTMAVTPLVIVVGIHTPIGHLAVSATQRVGHRLDVHYHATIAHSAARLSPQQLAEPRVSTALQAADRAVGRLDAVPGHALQLGTTAVTSVGLCVVIMSFDPVAGLLVIATLVPTLVAMTMIARVESGGIGAIADAERRASYAGEQLLQQRSGTELAVLGTGPKVAAMVRRHRLRRMLVIDRLISAGMRWELIGAVATSLLLAAAMISMITVDAGPAVAAAAIAGLLSGLSAIRFTGFAFGNIVATAPQASAYREVLALAESGRTQTLPGPHSVGRIDTRGLTVRYRRTERPAVEDVCISAERGEIIALVGVNGAGKTTTVNALLGVVDAGGQVLIDGRNAGLLTSAERLAHFGVLTQEFGRYEFTVREAVTLGTPATDLTDEQIHAALAAAKIDDLIRGLPDGLDSQLGQQWGGVGLSGGQWQRLALARSQLRNAPIWILDEPTSSIDAEAERAIFAELQESRADRITIVVSHRAWTLRGMDRIYVFDDGRIVQTGNFGTLINRPGRFAELFAEQLQDRDRLRRPNY